MQSPSLPKLKTTLFPMVAPHLPPQAFTSTPLPPITLRATTEQAAQQHPQQLAYLCTCQTTICWPATTEQARFQIPLPKALRFCLQSKTLLQITLHQQQTALQFTCSQATTALFQETLQTASPAQSASTLKAQVATTLQAIP